jgi:hypothetical protein
VLVIPNLAAVSGICAITASGMCPLSADNLKSDGGIATAGAAGAATGAEPNNLDQVPAPTIPSAVSPLAACHAFTFASVPGPN